jgi:MFS family permease
MNFCIKNLNIDAAQIQWMLIPVLLIGTPLFILFASLSDKIGRKWIMLTGMALAALFYFPIYHAMADEADYKNLNAVPVTERKINKSGDSLITSIYNYSNGMVRTEKIEKLSSKSFKTPKFTAVLNLPQKNIFIIGLLIFAQLLFVCMAYGPIAAFLVELFPTNIRYTSLSLPYHIGNGVFGGLTPLIAEVLVVNTGNIFAGLWYPVSIAAITVVLGAFLIKEKKIA